MFALYRQMKQLGAFDGITDVMELGAQNAWCTKPGIVKSLFEAFGKPPPPADMLERFATRKGSARELYIALGFRFACIDVDPNFESIRLDLNFDDCPPEHMGKYGFVTNHGTSEHLLNQLNFFKVMHELAKPGGMMLHAVPFTVQLEHGFFNYQPNLFEALARYNGYRVHGVWIGPDWQLASFVPYTPELIDYLVLNSKTTHLLIVLLQKMHDTKFCVPFQGVYEEMAPEHVMARYELVVDGDLYDGKRVKHITKEGVIAEHVARETLVVKNEYDSLHGKYWDVVTRLAAAESRIENELAPLKIELVASLLRTQALLQEPDIRNKRGDEAYLANNYGGRTLTRALFRRILRRITG